MVQTPKGATYPVNNLVEMARIPADARERMLASLPALLDHLAAQLPAMDKLAQCAGGVHVGPANLTWTDDDDDTTRTSITIRGEDI